MIYSNRRCSVKANNTGPLFVIFIIIGICSVTLLPVAIELGVELTRNADGSSALLWFLCVLLLPKLTKKILIHTSFCFRKWEPSVYRLYLE
jgi:hypothetical protein